MKVSEEEENVPHCFTICVDSYGLACCNNMDKFLMICFCLVRFASKEAATQAIVSIHGAEVIGHSVKCSWGKESSDPSQGGASSPPQGAASPSQVS